MSHSSAGGVQVVCRNDSCKHRQWISRREFDRRSLACCRVCGTGVDELRTDAGDARAVAAIVRRERLPRLMA